MCVFPARAAVPVGHVVGQKEGVVVGFDGLVDVGNSWRAGLAALRLEDFDDGKRCNFGVAGITVFVVRIQRHGAGERRLLLDEELAEEVLDSGGHSGGI